MSATAGTRRWACPGLVHVDQGLPTRRSGRGRWLSAMAARTGVRRLPPRHTLGSVGLLPGSNELDALRRRVEEAYADYLRDLEELVNIDSGSYTRAGVDRVSGWMMGRLSDLGASVARHPHEGLGDTMVATLERDVEGATVLMVGHADTVFEAGTGQSRPCTIDGERAFGPGVSDMEGGLLAGLYALTAARESRPGRGMAPGPPHHLRRQSG